MSARMPGGEPRSVPDPDGELYDRSLRGPLASGAGSNARSATRQRFTMPQMTSPALASLREARPAFRQTVNIGGRIYRTFDNGRADVLTPADDPFLSPSDLAARRHGLAVAQGLADSPLGGVAYSIATLLGGTSNDREQALAIGQLVDQLAAAGQVSGTRRQRAPNAPRPMAASPVRRPNIRPSELNATGQAQGYYATVEPPMLGTGSRSNQRIKPPGWSGHGTKHNEARGHLLANELGGSGGDRRNLFTQTQNGSNNGPMSGFERQIADRVRGGEIIEYGALPLYRSPNLPPRSILLTATGSRQAPVARLVPNPAGRRK